MTQKEVAEMLAKVKTVYSYAYRDMTKEDKEALLDTWYMLFRDYEKSLVFHAFASALHVCKMPITPADIFEQILKIENTAQKGEEELWDEFMVAARKAEDIAYHFRFTAILPGDSITQGERARLQADEFFKELPEEIKEFCNSFAQLATFGAVSCDELTQFVRPNFMRRIPQLRERAKIIKNTPSEFLSLASGLADQMAIEGKVK